MNASPNPFRMTLSITFLEDRLAPAGTSPYLPPLPAPGPIVVIAPPCQPASEPPRVSNF